MHNPFFSRNRIVVQNSTTHLKIIKTREHNLIGLSARREFALRRPGGSSLRLNKRFMEPDARKCFFVGVSAIQLCALLQNGAVNLNPQ
jgi:hypothetical protein